jgi:excinuclease ABC subunit C
VLGDGARYFGPYTDVKALRTTLRFLRRLFPIRTCRNIDRYIKDDRPCLNAHIKRCVAPCWSVSGIDAAAHRALVDRFALFLAGRDEDLKGALAADMKSAARERRYEDAAGVRDRLALLERVARGQRVLGPRAYDADAIGLARHGDRAVVVALHVREGRVAGQETRLLRGVRDQGEARILHEFILQHYLRAATWPKALWLPLEPEDAEVLGAALRAEGRSLAFEAGKRGRARTLLAAAAENARLALEVALARKGGRRVRYQPGVYELQRALGLPEPPFRVVCFDVSNIQGADPTASITVMENGQPRRGDYRKMRLKTPGPDDFAMMKEAVGRYFAHVAAGEWPRPDLVVIDGGIGQVGAAAAALAAHDLATLPLVGLAKREETIVRPDGQEVRLPRRSFALRSLMRLRDEAHRFAITYHRTLRSKRTIRSALDDVPGVGPSRRRALLGAFGSIAALAAADVPTIVERAGVPRIVAVRVKDALDPARDAGGAP